MNSPVRAPDCQEIIWVEKSLQTKEQNTDELLCDNVALRLTDAKLSVNFHSEASNSKKLLFI